MPALYFQGWTALPARCTPDWIEIESPTFARAIVRSDETLLTGDTLAKVTAAAKAKVPGGTIVRVETDADGHAAYEAHMTADDGSETTVYVDKSFNVVSVGSR